MKIGEWTKVMNKAVMTFRELENGESVDSSK